MPDDSSYRRLLDAISALGADVDLGSLLRNIIEVATDLVGARYGALGVLDRDRRELAQFITTGIDRETRDAIGDFPTGHGVLGVLIRDAEPVRVRDLTDHPSAYGFPANHPPMTSFLGVPVRVGDEVFGNFYLTDKIDGDEFTDDDMQLAVALASAAGIAIQAAMLHSRVAELRLAEDRQRIAEDLHDTVIQRLFATGLLLQGTVPLVGADPDAAGSRLESAIDELDVAVRETRSVIFALHAAGTSPVGVRDGVYDLVHEAAHTLGFSPDVSFHGPVETALNADAAHDLLSTLREALSNIARHANATHAVVRVAVDGTDVVLTVIDNGIGLPDDRDPGRGEGLGNMHARAVRRGGSFELQAGPPAGLVLVWRIPMKRTTTR